MSPTNLIADGHANSTSKSFFNYFSFSNLSRAFTSKRISPQNIHTRGIPERTFAKIYEAAVKAFNFYRFVLYVRALQYIARLFMGLIHAINSSPPTPPQRRKEKSKLRSMRTFISEPAYIPTLSVQLHFIIAVCISPESLSSQGHRRRVPNPHALFM